MQYLKADVANTVTIGPAVAVGDGFVPVTNLVGASADEYEIIKHGATATTSISAVLSAISGADGYYSLVLSAGECDTEGRFTILINDDDLILPIKHEFMVVAANVYDSLYSVSGTDLLDVQVAGMDTDVLTAAAVDSGAIHSTAIASASIRATSFVANAIDNAAMATNAISSDTLDANCITNVQMANSSITGGVTGTLATDCLSSEQLSTNAVDEIRDAILDEATSSHVGAGTVGEVLDNLPNDGALTFLDASILGRTLASAAYFDPALDDVDVRAIQANVVTAAAINADAITAAKLAADVTTEIVAGMNDVSTADVLAQVNTALNAAMTELTGEPGATPSIREAAMLLHMAIRNRLDTFTSGTDALRIYNNAGAIIATKALSDAGGDYSEAQMT